MHIKVLGLVRSLLWYKRRWLSIQQVLIVLGIFVLRGMTDGLGMNLKLVLTLLSWWIAVVWRLVSYLSRLTVNELDLEATEHSRSVCSILLFEDNYLVKHVLLLKLAQWILLRWAACTLLIGKTSLAPSVWWIKLWVLLKRFLAMAGSSTFIVNFVPTLLAKSLLTLSTEDVAMCL